MAEADLKLTQTALTFARHLQAGRFPYTRVSRNMELPQAPPELAATVANIYNAIPEPERLQCAIFMGNYGEAGAVDYFGPQYGLPPSISAHQNYFFWGPRQYTGDCILIMAGSSTREKLAPNYTSVVEAGETNAPYAIPMENHRTIWLYRGRKPGTLTLQQIWPQLKLWI